MSHFSEYTTITATAAAAAGGSTVINTNPLTNVMFTT